LAFISANAWAPSWLSCSCDTAPTICVRPVGDVVVAQAASASGKARIRARGFMAGFPGQVLLSRPRDLKVASIMRIRHRD
jgi:hypothetical protein